MSTEQVIWLAGAALASIFLSKMMRDRQIHLSGLIRKSVEEKLDWTRKRSKALQLARRTARRKAVQERQITSPVEGIRESSESQEAFVEESSVRSQANSVS